MPFGLTFIKTATTGVVETFGRFTGTVKPGLNLYVPFIQKVTPISNRLLQNNFKVEAKTKDNVFTRLNIAVQYQVTESDTEKAFYSLADPLKQIDTYIENIIRSQVPNMELDELFSSQDEIRNSVKDKLSTTMSNHGYTIVDTLITEIDPASEVKVAMNKINASQRLRESAKNEADAEYIKTIRQSESDRDRKRLQGEGISQQRQAIMRGYQEGVENMTKALGLSAQQIVDFVLKTQHLDAIEMIGKSPNTKTIFLNHNPENASIMSSLEGVDNSNIDVERLS